MQDKNHNYEGCVRAYDALAEASARVTDHLARELEAGFGLTISEFDVLLALSGQPDGSMRLSALLGRVRLSQPALSRLVDRLQRRGLTNRLADAGDRRSVKARITVKGRRLLEEAVPVHARCIRDSLLDRLTLEERTAFKAILMKISERPAEEHEPESALRM